MKEIFRDQVVSKTITLLDASGAEVGFPAWNFILTFYTTDKSKGFVASSIDGVMEKVSNNGGKVRVFLFGHNLEAGTLKCDIEAAPTPFNPDEGEALTVAPLDILIVEEAAASSGGGGGGLSAADKAKLDSLENYDDTELRTMIGKKIESLSLPIVEQTETEATIEPDVLNRWGEVSALSIEFAPAKAGYAGEYCMEFTSGATATTLTLPAAVKWPEEPSIEANMRYQISVVNNIGLIAGVPFELGDAELASPNEPIGIGVLLKNGKKIDYAKMSETSSFPKEEVEGITLEKEGRSYIIAPTQIQCYFCNSKQQCYDAPLIGGSSAARMLYNGKENTSTLRASLTADSGLAVNQAYNTIVNGQNCWLPSLGELSLIWRYKAEIDALLAMCQCETLNKSNYWSSALSNRVDADGNNVRDTHSDAYLSYVFGIYQDGGLDGFNVQGLHYALPITDYTEGGAS